MVAWVPSPWNAVSKLCKRPAKPCLVSDVFNLKEGWDGLITGPISRYETHQLCGDSPPGLPGTFGHSHRFLPSTRKLGPHLSQVGGGAGALFSDGHVWIHVPVARGYLGWMAEKFGHTWTGAGSQCLKAMKPRDFRYNLSFSGRHTLEAFQKQRINQQKSSCETSANRSTQLKFPLDPPILLWLSTVDIFCQCAFISFQLDG